MGSHSTSSSASRRTLPPRMSWSRLLSSICRTATMTTRPASVPAALASRSAQTTTCRRSRTARRCWAALTSPAFTAVARRLFYYQDGTAVARCCSYVARRSPDIHSKYSSYVILTLKNLYHNQSDKEISVSERIFPCRKILSSLAYFSCYLRLRKKLILSVTRSPGVMYAQNATAARRF